MNDGKTTLLGVLMAALTAMQVDYVKLAHGDLFEIFKISTALLQALFGYYTNKKQQQSR
jgi:hypothetical protein